MSDDDEVVVVQPVPAANVVVDDSDSSLVVAPAVKTIQVTATPAPATVVRDTQAPQVVGATVTERVSVVTPGGRGPEGPPGAPSTIPGPAGPQGPPGAAGSAPQAYTHIQNLPAISWDITHNLGFHPSITAFDSAGTESIGEVEQLDVNSLRLHFSSAFSGTAYLS